MIFLHHKPIGTVRGAFNDTVIFVTADEAIIHVAKESGHNPYFVWC